MNSCGSFPFLKSISLCSLFSEIGSMSGYLYEKRGTWDSLQENGEEDGEVDVDLGVGRERRRY